MHKITPKNPDTKSLIYYLVALTIYLIVSLKCCTSLYGYGNSDSPEINQIQIRYTHLSAKQILHMNTVWTRTL